MKIVIAPDSFKESLTAIEVASTIKQAFLEVFPSAKIINLPLADGGEGTCETLIYSLGLKKIHVQSENPLGKPITGFYGFDVDNQTAYMDIATCSGLPLLTTEERNPLKASSYGTGLLIKNAIELGAKHIYIGLGGSATNDAGLGILQALGVRLLDKNQQEIPKGTEYIDHINSIEYAKASSLTQDVRMTILSDVQNPLYGELGASKIFAQQKGADENMINFLDNQLKTFANFVKQLNHDLIVDPCRPGMGAAGGAAFGLSMLFNNINIRSGIDVMLDKLQAEKAIQEANLVITGEGKLDNQTLLGKAPSGVAKMAKKHKVPVIAFSGILGHQTEQLTNLFDAFFPIIDDIKPLPDALKKAKQNLKRTALNAAKLLKLNILEK